MTTSLPDGEVRNSNTKIILSVILMVWVVLLLSQSIGAETATNYLRGKQAFGKKDPIVEFFKYTLYSSNTGRWSDVSKAIIKIKPALKIFKRELGVDLLAEYKDAVSNRNSKGIAKISAHLVFLVIRENLKNAGEDLDDYEEASKTLNNVQSYYEAILSGNIKRKEPGLHDDIMKEFKKAKHALGKLGVSGKRKRAPDPKGFFSATNTIETRIKNVYTYFNQQGEPQ